ncbi:hypothetical protein MFIFM68171_08396 [Madurella fahalii]|uniref:Uncharacterized protein n=1 Tax=Madurella fahalii TaxID=1157608 RepID=A0ABQ0GKD8_9PEZI
MPHSLRGSQRNRPSRILHRPLVPPTHSAPAPPNSQSSWKPSSRRVVPRSAFTYYDEYLKAVIGIAVLGGQITFTLIVSDIADPTRLSSENLNPDKAPASSVFKREDVRLLISLSWLCFTVSLGLGIFALVHSSNTLSSNGIPPSTSFFYTWSDGVIRVLNVLPMGAFLLLSLAVAAYVPIVGWVSVGFIVVYAVAVHTYWWIDPQVGGSSETASTASSSRSGSRASGDIEAWGARRRSIA